MKETKLLSVIVPVYGTERYIERCVRSLMEQSIENVEYIFVDDATEDRSIEILEKTVGDYPGRHVTILHNPANLGLAETRFTGIRAARGEYVYNCDSDDWLDTSMLQQMMDKALETDADIVACNAVAEYGTHTREINYTPDISEETVQNGLLALKVGEAEVALWNKVIRKSLIIRHSILPYPGVNMGEDSALTVRLRYYSRKTVIIHSHLYHYNLSNSNSMTSQPNVETVRQQMELARQIENFFINQGRIDDFRPLVNWYKFAAKRDLIYRFKAYRCWKHFFPEASADIMRFNYLSFLKRLKWRLFSLIPDFIFPSSEISERIFHNRL